MRKPLILGLDLSSHGGWAVYDLERSRSAIECGVYEFPEKSSPEYRGAQIGLKLASTIRWAQQAYGRPLDLAAIEGMAMTSIAGVRSTIISAALHGACYSTLANFGIAWGTVPVATWRAAIYGKGFKPPQKLVTKKIKGVKQQVPENDWKIAAVNACHDMQINLPPQKTIAHNAAEAACVAICWRSAKLHAKRYHDRFMALQQAA